MGSENSSITVFMIWVTFCVQHLQSCFASRTLRPGQAGTLISGLRRCVLLARSCGADLEDHQSVFRTLWRVQRSWSLVIPTEFRTLVSHEIVLSVAMSAWLQNVPELFPLTLLSRHCLLRPAEARQLRWFDVQFFDWIPINTLRKRLWHCSQERTQKRAE